MPEALTPDLQAGQRGGFGVYVHWPYCARICPYCDFNVYKNVATDVAAWERALVADLSFWAERTPGRALGSVYFGGGTPSLCPPGLVATVIETCSTLWTFTDDIEITLESNPTDAEIAAFSGFRAAGVNRLSLGVQSFDDSDLRFLGRNHDGAAASQALDLALKTFDRTTFDLIYALPGESEVRWRGRLSEALARGSEHISLYQLTVEPGTAFAKAVDRGVWRPSDEDLSADLFAATQEIAAGAGMPAYEISNHARPGGASRHNLIYWRGGDYIGVGPGAHGRVTLDGARLATETALAPGAYLANGGRASLDPAMAAPLSPRQAFEEKLAMGLRLLEGTPLSAEEHARIAERLAPLIADGLCERDGATLRLTQAGRPVLNGVLSALLT